MNGNEKNMTVVDLVKFIRDYSFNDFARIIISCEEINPDDALFVGDFTYKEFHGNDAFIRYEDSKVKSFAIWHNSGDLYDLWIEIEK